MAEASEAENSLESVPAQMGMKARQALDSAQADSNKKLAELRGKTNEVLQKAQGGLDTVVDKVYTGKNKVIAGIDAAIAVVETPLMGLAPLLREVANQGIQTVFATAERIPEQAVDCKLCSVDGGITSVKV